MKFDLLSLVTFWLILYPGPLWPTNDPVPLKTCHHEPPTPVNDEPITAIVKGFLLEN